MNSAGISRRLFLRSVGLTASVVASGGAITFAGRASAAESLRARYHLTPPQGWLSDPQRPIHADALDHLYYLHSDENNAPGWWQHATTSDQVAFTDQGTAIPLGPDFPVWTGSGVIDVENTAGFGAGTIVVLATQPTGGDRFQQEQYLWYSTDGGYTFTAYGDPVIRNPDGSDWFRDPKIIWDARRSEWATAIGRHQATAFYTSPDLKNWTEQSTFSYTTPNIGGFECPDLFEIVADDGTHHWVLGSSMQGDYSGLPDTFAYWTGIWDGHTFHTDTRDPQWLDWGWDWYAAVTWPNPASPESTRFAIAWMNNWHYANRTVPTDITDGYNGQMSVVRELTLSRQTDGAYSLLSKPAPALDGYTSRTIELGTHTVDGSLALDYRGDSYQLDVDLTWQQLRNVGLSVGRSPDGSRHTNIGIFEGKLYVDRRPSDRSDYTFLPYGQSEAPVDPESTDFHLTVLVDRQSVEVFTGDGTSALSNQVYFLPEDTGISFYTDGGTASFANVTIKEFTTTDE